jgi:hypothetical protein
MPVTKFVRIAVEGATSDGRTLSRSDIEQMGKNYNPTKYGARIWLEHLRGLLPDSLFKAYGDVLETKTEEFTLDGVKKLALLAKLDVTEELIGFNKKRQKIYTSIEIAPNFAQSGEAYLAGLAVTDSPASLGTEALKLFSSRKQAAENMFTTAVETEIDIEDEPQVDNLGINLFNKVKELLGISDKTTEHNFTGISQAVEAIATSQKSVLDQFAAHAKQVETLQADIKKLTEDHTKVSKDFADLTAKLENEPDNKNPRNRATGADGKLATDC